MKKYVIILLSIIVAIPCIWFVWRPLVKLMPNVYHEIKEMISFYKVDNLEYKSHKAILEEKNYLKAIKYSTKYLAKAIDKYGQYDSITFKKFYNAYSTYKLTIPRINYSGYYSSYDDHLKMVYKWRELCSSLEKNYGSNYVDSLYHFALSGDTLDLYGLDSYERNIPYAAMSYRDEILVNVYFKRLNTIDDCSESLYKEMKKGDIDLGSNDLFLLVKEIAEEIERQGYLDHAYNYIFDYYERIPKNEYSLIIEKLNTELALLAWRAGNVEILSRYVHDASLLSPIENGIEYYKSFYDINDLLRQLILVSRYYEINGDDENRKLYLSIAEQLVERGLYCKNGKILNNTTKAMFYSEYGVGALYDKDYIKAEKFLELVPQIDSIWFNTNVPNLAYAYIKNGKYDKSADLISKYYANSTGLVFGADHNLSILECQIELAIHNNNKLSLVSKENL